MTTVSFQGGRTIAETGYGATACNWRCTFSRSAGACSMSTSTQSNPAPAQISAAVWLARLNQQPACLRFSLSPRLNALMGMSMLLLLPCNRLLFCPPL